MTALAAVPADAADPWPDPWSVLIVEHDDDAATLAQPYADAGVTVVTLADRALADVVRGQCVLLADRASRCAGDVLALGAASVLEVWTPPPWRSLGDFAEQAINRAGAETNAELVELCRVVTDRARVAQVAPTGHPAFAGGGAVVRDWTDVATDPPVRYLLAGLLAEKADHVLGGQPGAGKSAVATAMSMAAAHGTGSFGADLRRPFSSLFLVGEGMRGLGARLRAWRAANPAARPADGQFVAYRDGVPNLLEPEAAAAWIDATVAQCVATYGHGPDVVWLDTFARATPGIEENDNGEMGAAQGVLTAAGRRHGCATVAIHHVRKAPTAPRKFAHATDLLGELRGAGSLAGAVDVALFAMREGDRRYLAVGKARDGADGASVDYCLSPVLTGAIGDGGEPERAPIVVLAAAPAAQPVVAAGDSQLEADVARVVDALRELGAAPSKGAIVAAAHMKRGRGVAVVDLAVARGLIVETGTSRAKCFRLSESAGGVCAALPHTPGDAGTPRVHLGEREERERERERELDPVHPDHPAEGGE